MHRLLAIVLLSLLVFAADSSFMATPALGATSTTFSPNSVNLATGQSTTITIAAVGLAPGAIALQFQILHNTENTRISNAQCVGLFAGFDVGHGTQANIDGFTCTSPGGAASGTSGNVLSFTLTNTGGGSDTLSFNNALSYYLQATFTTTEPLGTTNTLVVTGSATPPPHKAVVFFSGVCTTLDNGTGSLDGGGTFRDLQNLLAQPVGQGGYGYNSATDFLAYSYLGGTVNSSGVWQHNAYTEMVPASTDFTTIGLSRLHDELLIPYRNAHPNTTFVLAGHSLGGAVAIQEAVRNIDSANYPPGLISAIITADSPLLGAPLDDRVKQQFIAHGLSCLVDGQAITLLKSRFSESSYTNFIQAVASRVKAKGVTLANVGNQADCLYAWSQCLNDVWPAGLRQFPDVTYTQWIPGPDVFRNQFSIASQQCTNLSRLRNCVLDSHGAVLKAGTAQGQNALRAIADYVGRQN